MKHDRGEGKVTINKDRLLYKIVYYFWDKKNEPTGQINICKFIRDMVLGGLTWIFMGIAALIASPFLLAMFLMLLVTMFSFGWRLIYLNVISLNDRQKFVRCSRWPNIKGYRILPIYFVPPVFLFYFGSVIVSSISNVAVNVGNAVVSSWGLAIVGTVAVLVLVCWGIYRFTKSELYKLLKVFLAAKKEKICPMITIVEDENLVSEE
ncbi:hypothetical protein CL630_01915, partial [bacterium]|nr:hypothetical protein [bacterium]